MTSGRKSVAGFPRMLKSSTTLQSCMDISRIENWQRGNYENWQRGNYEGDPPPRSKFRQQKLHAPRIFENRPCSKNTGGVFPQKESFLALKRH